MNSATVVSLPVIKICSKDSLQNLTTCGMPCDLLTRLLFAPCSLLCAGVNSTNSSNPINSTDSRDSSNSMDPTNPSNPSNSENLQN